MPDLCPELFETVDKANASSISIASSRAHSPRDARDLYSHSSSAALIALLLSRRKFSMKDVERKLNIIVSMQVNFISILGIDGVFDKVNNLFQL